MNEWPTRLEQAKKKFDPELGSYGCVCVCVFLAFWHQFIGESFSFTVSQMQY